MADFPKGIQKEFRRRMLLCDTLLVTDRSADFGAGKYWVRSSKASFQYPVSIICNFILNRYQIPHFLRNLLICSFYSKFIYFSPHHHVFKLFYFLKICFIVVLNRVGYGVFRSFYGIKNYSYSKKTSNKCKFILFLFFDFK